MQNLGSTYDRKQTIFAFSACYISLNVISICFSFTANDRILFFMVKQNSIVYTYDIFFTYSSIGRHLSWFHKLTTTDAAIRNMTVQTLCGMLTYFFEHILTRMNAESCSSYNFSVYRSFHADFHSGWTNLHSEHLCVFPFPTSPPPTQEFSLICFLSDR